MDRALAEAACAVNGGGPLDEAAFKTAMDAALVVDASRVCVRTVKARVESDLESEAASSLGGRREGASFPGGRREEASFLGGRREGALLERLRCWSPSSTSVHPSGTSAATAP